ncbi:MAG: glycosyltransferase [Peptococcaceae bacterium]|nr:glycosyltransferase [Peptococcaceae bacterium]
MEHIVLVMAAVFALFMLGHVVPASCGLRRINRSPETKPAVGVSVVKPVKGLDADVWNNFRSFCEQDYKGPYEIIFSLQDKSDPALPLLYKLKEKYSGVDIKIIVNPVKEGLTGKSSNLLYGARMARHPYLVFSDADMYVEKDFITKIVAPLLDHKVGLVSALPVHVDPKGLWALVYQLQLNGTVLAQWLPYAGIFKLGVAGGTIAVRRDVLDEIGGIEAFGGYVAEDVKIGQMVVEAGYEVRVGPPVISPVGAKSYEDAVSLLARGALIYRRMLHTALEIPFMVVAYFYGVAGIGYLLTGMPEYLYAFLVHLGGKMLTMFLVTRRAGTGGKEALVLPVMDAVFLWTYIRIVVQGTLSWRGITYHVDREGRMIR